MFWRMYDEFLQLLMRESGEETLNSSSYYKENNLNIASPLFSSPPLPSPPLHPLSSPPHLNMHSQLSPLRSDFIPLFPWQLPLIYFPQHLSAARETHEDMTLTDKAEHRERETGNTEIWRRSALEKPTGETKTWVLGHLRLGCAAACLSRVGFFFHTDQKPAFINTKHTREQITIITVTK